MQGGIWALCVGLLSHCFVTDTQAAEATRFMTYNIRYMNPGDGLDVWGNRSTVVMQTISKVDVVGLQEVVLQQFEDIQRATHDDFEWYGRGRDDGDKQGEMTPIGWRKNRFESIGSGTFWLSKNPQQVGEKSWDAALPRIASWVKLRRKADGLELLVVNTHFDHRGQEARRQSARLLRKWIADHREAVPTILMGDLNAELSDAPLDELLKPELQDAPNLTDSLAATQTPPVGPNSTWNGFRSIEEGRRIDHLLFIGDIQVVAFATLDPRTIGNRFASDHLPVMVTAKL